MSQPASSSKIRTVVKRLAIFLALGLGAYYVYLQLPALPSKTAKEIPATATRTREQASQALLALPEIKAWSSQIEKYSGGKVHGALMEYDPAPRVIKGKSYWQISFVENSAAAALRLESFLVAQVGDEILIEDPATDGVLSLERWRLEKRPMQRIASGAGGG